jgi:hypothetical protein
MCSALSDTMFRKLLDESVDSGGLRPSWVD